MSLTHRDALRVIQKIDDNPHTLHVYGLARFAESATLAAAPKIEHLLECALWVILAHQLAFMRFSQGDGVASLVKAARIRVPL